MPLEQPPEGVLIESARRTSGLSVREAARRAGISEGWWRQVVKGYQSLSGGASAPVRAPADTVAKMSRVVGVTPERVEVEGQRPDAAEKMRTVPLQATGPGVPDAEQPADPGVVSVARQYGIDPDNADDRWLRQVRKQIADAIMIHGADATGPQIFHDQPASHIEAAIWDDPHATRKSKELFIAAMRADRAGYEAGQQGNGRSGTAGLAPLLTLAGR